MGYTGLSQREFFEPSLSRDGVSAGMASLAFGVRRGSLLMGMEAYPRFWFPASKL